MNYIEERILKDGIIINNDIIKVDSFINHQIDLNLIERFALDVANHYKDKKIDKVLTIETSGIAIAYAVASKLGNVPLLFAKKTKSQITDNNVYKVKIKSFTRNIDSEVTVNKNYLLENENILIVDDFLAEGNAGLGLINMCEQAKSNVIGFVTLIEKSFQPGRSKIEEKGVEVYAGASIKAFKDNKPVF